MRETELSTLEQARVQVGKVARIRAKCGVIVPRGAYKSPSFSAMPGSGEPCGLDGSARECEKLLEELKREERKLRQMDAQCRKIIDRSGMKAEMKEFCCNYYLRRMSVKEAADHIGMSERTGWNYKAEIEAARRPKKQGHTRKNGPKNAQKNLQ